LRKNTNFRHYSWFQTFLHRKQHCIDIIYSICIIWVHGLAKHATNMHSKQDNGNSIIKLLLLVANLFTKFGSKVCILWLELLRFFNL
jgi:hypothetical protein